MQPFCVFCRKSGHPTSTHDGRKVFSPAEIPHVNVATEVLSPKRQKTSEWKAKNREKVKTYQRDYMRQRRAHA